MDKRAVSLIKISLALGIAFPLPHAHAIPSTQNPVVAAAQAVTNDPDANPLAEAGVSGPDTDLARPHGSDEASASAAIPCMQGVAKGSNNDGNPATSCAAPTTGLRPLSFQMGRRMGVNSGILDSYDGVRVDYRLSNGLNLNAVAGYPDIAKPGPFNSAKRVFGFSGDTAKFARAWDMNSFYIERQDKGGAISRAIGGALRYLQPRRSMLVFVDYDVADHTLGALTATGAWKLYDKTTFSTTFDVRNNPVKTRQKRYLQKTMAATAGWSWNLPADRIRHFTNDRSEEVTTLAFGLSHSFSERLKLTGSAARLAVSSNPAAQPTGSAPTQPSEYFYNLKLTARDLVLSGDRSRLDLRHSITESSRISSAAIDTHYAINRTWKITPRVRTDYRNNWLTGSVRWVTSPAVKMEYRRKKHYGFQIEAGGEWSSEQLASEVNSRASYFLSLGYQAKF